MHFTLRKYTHAIYIDFLSFVKIENFIGKILKIVTLIVGTQRVPTIYVLDQK